MTLCPRPADPVTTVYTDGSCLGNPGPGGWAWAVDGGPSDSGGEPHTTNQRMEVTAVVRALQALSGPLHVMSDSTYVVNCFRQKWWEGWERRGWRNSQGKPVANQDLWKELLGLALDPAPSGDLRLGEGALGGPDERRGGPVGHPGRGPPVTAGAATGFGAGPSLP